MMTMILTKSPVNILKLICILVFLYLHFACQLRCIYSVYVLHYIYKLVNQHIDWIWDLQYGLYESIEN